MPLTLYAHPFASYCWKPLIALYENATPFTYRLVEDAAAADVREWPQGRLPATPIPAFSGEFPCQQRADKSNCSINRSL